MKIAKLLSCTQERVQLPGGSKLMWVATDTAKRRFIAETKIEAEKMLTDYNRKTHT